MEKIGWKKKIISKKKRRKKFREGGKLRIEIEDKKKVNKGFWLLEEKGFKKMNRWLRKEEKKKYEDKGGGRG